MKNWLKAWQTFTGRQIEKTETVYFTKKMSKKDMLQLHEIRTG